MNNFNDKKCWNWQIVLWITVISIDFWANNFISSQCSNEYHWNAMLVFCESINVDLRNKFIYWSFLHCSVRTGKKVELMPCFVYRWCDEKRNRIKLLFQVQNEHHDFDPWFISYYDISKHIDSFKCGKKHVFVTIIYFDLFVSSSSLSLNRFMFFFRRSL